MYWFEKNNGMTKGQEEAKYFQKVFRLVNKLNGDDYNSLYNPENRHNYKNVLKSFCNEKMDGFKHLDDDTKLHFNEQEIRDIFNDIVYNERFKTAIPVILKHFQFNV